MNSTSAATHKIQLGAYSILHDGLQFKVNGDCADTCNAAREALYLLLKSDDGKLLIGGAFGSALTTATQQARSQLAAAIGLPIIKEERKRELNYDDDHSAIRALNFPRMAQRSIDELAGIAAGIVHDRKVSGDEIAMLTEWMDAHKEFHDEWPMCDLVKLMARIRDAAVLTEEQHSELYRFLESIGATAQGTGSASDVIFTDNPKIEFPDKSFLFTGKLMVSKREVAQAAVTERGGIVAKSPTIRLDYLVVGDLGTDAWKHSRFGLKIKSVMDNRQNGAKTLIVREADFVAAVRATPKD